MTRSDSASGGISQVAEEARCPSYPFASTPLPAAHLHPPPFHQTQQHRRTELPAGPAAKLLSGQSCPTFKYVMKFHLESLHTLLLYVTVLQHHKNVWLLSPELVSRSGAEFIPDHKKTRLVEVRRDHRLRASAADAVF